jgi:phospholipase/carboxylesterase
VERPRDHVGTVRKSEARWTLTHWTLPHTTLRASGWYDRAVALTRRRFFDLGFAMGITAAATQAIACASAQTTPSADREQARGRLKARPQPSTSPQRPVAAAGERALGLGQGRDGLLYIPRDLPASGPVPLVLMLHGAHGSAKGITNRVGVQALADEFKTIVLTPDSRDQTWDVTHGGFGPDVAFIDAALTDLFTHVTIDPTHIAIAGFSDGASYALSLGLINGDLFTHVIAFSPGFLVAEQRQGQPAIFVSHGTADEILPIETTSRRIVPGLRSAGYTVDFREFAGPHTVPPSIAHDAFAWMSKTHK